MKDTSPTPQQPPKGGMSLVGSIAILFGLLMLLFSLLSVLNTAFGWNMQVKGVNLPKHWDATIGLIGATVIFWAIWAFLTYVGPVRRFGRKYPWLMALFVVAALVGAIVIITVIDNANIRERRERAEKIALQDSLKRVEDTQAMFGDQPVPYRLAVVNPQGQAMQVFIRDSLLTSIPAYEMRELQLPWEPFKMLVRVDGKDFASKRMEPDPSMGESPATLHVYNPKGQYDILVFNYDTAYASGVLDVNSVSEAREVDRHFGEELFAVEDAGPFYVMVNQQAPPSTKYSVFRLVLMPEELERDYLESQQFARWVLRRIDNLYTHAPPESPSDQYQAWKAGH